MPLTICSWNVNGLRAVVRTGHLRGWLERDLPDVVGMQEVKASPGQVDPSVWRDLGYRETWHAASRPGYSGILVLYRDEPDAIRAGLGIEDIDVEGRVVEVDVGPLTLLTAYFPNGGRKGDRLPYKYAFYETFLERLNGLRAAGRGVLFMGDLNVAHLDFDVARPDEAIKGTGFLPEERAWLDRLAAEDYVDTFRALQPDVRDAYTYWEPWRERRARNIGWRIDYVWVSKELAPAVRRAFIVADVMGSDHCPVGVEFES